MNRKHKILLPLLGLCLVLTSCQKYLDIKENNQITPFENANDVQLLLNDYASMNTGYPCDLQASGDDYYLLNNFYLSSKISPEEQSIHTWVTGAVRQTGLENWQQAYNIIFRANLALENVEKFRNTTDKVTADDIRGQALFFRAFSFWNVAQLYCKPYESATAGSNPGIPIRLSSDINGISDRSTVQHTYDQIVNDLKEAVNLMPVLNPTIKSSRPNKAAAYAMLSRVYLSMGNYSSALSNATSCLDILDKKNYSLLDYNTSREVNQTSETPFQRFNKEVLFHAIITERPFLSPQGETNTAAGIVPLLYNQYETNDLRKTVLFKPNKSTDLNTGVTGFDGTYRFTGNYEPRISAAQFNGLALDEVYLTRAECYARTGNAVGAIDDLNALLVTRWKSGTYSNIPVGTADDALNKVLIERRKELVFRSLRWTDIRRLKLAATRNVVIITYAGTPPNAQKDVSVTTYTLPAGDTRYTLQIPQDVIDNAHGAIPQNPK